MKTPTWTILALLLVACGPSAEDEANMTKKMSVETARAELIHQNAADCPKLGTELAAWTKSHEDELKTLDDWWMGLSDGKKDKLIENHRAEWDKQSLALVEGGLKCNAEMKAGMKAGL
jgi:hypothetical protein